MTRRYWCRSCRRWWATDAEMRWARNVHVICDACLGEEKAGARVQYFEPADSKPNTPRSPRVGGLRLFADFHAAGQTRSLGVGESEAAKLPPPVDDWDTT